MLLAQQIKYPVKSFDTDVAISTSVKRCQKCPEVSQRSTLSKNIKVPKKIQCEKKKNNVKVLKKYEKMSHQNFKPTLSNKLNHFTQ